MVRSSWHHCGPFSYQSRTSNTFASEWSQKGLNFISDIFGLMKLLKLWRASIWRVIWGEVLTWMVFYAVVSFSYRELMDSSQRLNFLAWCNYCDSFSSYISTPLSIAIGFFMSTVYSRWWEQWNTAIGWAEPLAYHLVSVLPEATELQHKQRCTIFRWVQASHSLTYIDYAGTYNQVVHDVAQLTARGLLTEEEARLIRERGENAPYDLPLVWAHTMLNHIDSQDTKRGASFALQMVELRKELLANRMKDATLRGFDYIPVPIPQLQTISFAVYAYFVINLFGRQFVMDVDRDDPRVAAYKMASVNDYYCPFLSLVELGFYFGWLKCVSLIFDPFADAGYSFNLLEIEAGVIKRVHTIFEQVHQQVMPQAGTAGNLFGYPAHAQLDEPGASKLEVAIKELKPDTVAHRNPMSTSNQDEDFVL